MHITSDNCLLICKQGIYASNWLKIDLRFIARKKRGMEIWICAHKEEECHSTDNGASANASCGVEINYF